MKKRLIIGLILGIVLINLVLINAGLPIYVKDLDNPSTAIAYNFTLTSGIDCTGILLSNSSTITLDASGIGFFDMPIDSLTSIPQRICVYRDAGTFVANLSFADMVLNSLRVNQLIATDANISNLTVGNNINVTGNILASYFIGDGSSLTGVTATYFNDTYANLLNQNCPTGKVVNGTNSSGGFICVTPTAVEVDPAWQGNVTSGLSQDLNVNSQKLTDVGELIMNGLIRSQNMTPITDNLYSLGNSTNWFKEIWVKNIYATDINTTNLIASDIDTNNIDSITTNTTNLTLGGFELFKDGDGNLNINLD